MRTLRHRQSRESRRFDPPMKKPSIARNPIIIRSVSARRRTKYWNSAVISAHVACRHKENPGGSQACRNYRPPASPRAWTAFPVPAMSGRSSSCSRSAGCFEFYDLFFTAYVAPGLTSGGMFSTTTVNLFGFSGFASFVAALFAGLFVGTLCLRLRRGQIRPAWRIFTFSLLWYTVGTVVMAFQYTALSIDLWRFIAGIGIGVELVTIDTYVSELTPKQPARPGLRLQSIQSPSWWCRWWPSYPTSWSPSAPLGFDGWRWVVLIGAVGAVFVWWIRLGIPRIAALADPAGPARRMRTGSRRTSRRRVAAETGPLPAPAPAVGVAEKQGGFLEIWQPPYRSRTLLMSFYNLFQAIGYTASRAGSRR